MCVGNVNDVACFAPFPLAASGGTQQAAHTAPDPTSSVRGWAVTGWQGECKQWCSLAPLALDRVPALLLLFGGEHENQLPAIIVVVGFKPSDWQSFFSTPEHVSLCSSSSAISLPTSRPHWGWAPSITMSPALLPFFLWSFYLSLCRTCSLRPLFFLEINFSG